ncbi:MAG: lysophospholipid acyltransferase family protein [bacterium]|nr:lysophospholipid acyltransferase family protein [bacterium]
MIEVMRSLFFLLIVRPLIMVVIGLNIRRWDELPKRGPAIIVASHNSHLDTLVLMSLFPLQLLPKLRPVAAADHFLRSRLLAWFTLNIIGIIPIERRGEARPGGDPFAACHEALALGDILILFPEGTRGEPEKLLSFKNGIGHLAERHPDVPVVPIFLHGLGKALPKGEGLLVPFICDGFVGEPLYCNGDRSAFMGELYSHMKALAAEGGFPTWE